MSERFYLYDETEDTRTRYISFMGDELRYDLAITVTNRYYGKKLVLDLQSNRFAIVGEDDLNEPGYLEHAYQITSPQAAELRDFLLEII